MVYICDCAFSRITTFPNAQCHVAIVSASGADAEK